MCQAIGERNVPGAQGDVVHSSLLKVLFTERQTVGFTLYEHPGTARTIMHQQVAALLQFVDIQASLYFDERSRVASVVYEVVQKMLTHPLFWCELYVLLAAGVKDPGRVSFLLELQVMRRQIKGRMCRQGYVASAYIQT